MIDKQDFYHGAALVKAFETSKCKSISKYELGYLINSELSIVIKYTTKHRSPWIFTFSENDCLKINKIEEKGMNIFLVLVCGGDGICSLTYEEYLYLTSNEEGWISAKRNFHEQYAVSGSKGELNRKISYKRWPELLFL